MGKRGGGLKKYESVDRGSRGGEHGTGNAGGRGVTAGRRARGKTE